MLLHSTEHRNHNKWSHCNDTAGVTSCTFFFSDQLKVSQPYIPNKHVLNHSIPLDRHVGGGCLGFFFVISLPSPPKKMPFKIIVILFPYCLELQRSYANPLLGELPIANTVHICVLMQHGQTLKNAPNAVSFVSRCLQGTCRSKAVKIG